MPTKLFWLCAHPPRWSPPSNLPLRREDYGTLAWALMEHIPARADVVTDDVRRGCTTSCCNRPETRGKKLWLVERTRQTAQAVHLFRRQAAICPMADRNLISSGRMARAIVAFQAGV